MIEYAIRRSHGSRLVRLTVYPGGSVVVTAPSTMDDRAIKGFVLQKMPWILKKMSICSRMVPMRPTGIVEYREYRAQAQAVLTERIIHWNQSYGFGYHRIVIKNQRSLWGSCSKRGNINLNYRLLFLPIELRDYVVVHELCHLKEHNHSPRFWGLVAQALPEYRQARLELRRYSSRGVPASFGFDQ